MSWLSLGSSPAGSNPTVGAQLKLLLKDTETYAPTSSSPLMGGKIGATPPSIPTWDVNKDTDRLFREHRISEVQEIEKQTRLDIDQRREDLRQMVG